MNAQAYIWSAVVMVVFFVVNLIIAHAVGRDENHTGAGARRFWFWLFAVLSGVVAFFINLAIAHSDIADAHLRQIYINNSIVGAGAAFVVFVGLGYILSSLFHHSKIGTWFYNVPKIPSAKDTTVKTPDQSAAK